MADIIQVRRDLAANWTSANPTLAQGELGLETDTIKIKYGDGSTAWNSLGYFVAVADGKVGIDSGATPDYLGAANNDGVLRTDATLDYTDGGNFITLSLDSTLKSNYDAAFSHVSADGSSHAFLDQSVTIGASPTFAGLTMAGNIVMGDNNTIGQSTGPLIRFDDSNNILNLSAADGGVQGVYLQADELNASYNVEANAVLFVNYSGFQGSDTQFRDIGIYNGKGGLIAFFTGATSRLGIRNAGPSFTLDITGDGRFTGKLTTLGAVDPPGVLYDSETRMSTVARIKREIPKDKLSGCFMFYNGDTENMELFFPTTGKFKDFDGVLLDTVDPIAETFDVIDDYFLDELTGEVIKTQVSDPKNKRYKVKKGYKFDNKTGKFYDKDEKRIVKDTAVELKSVE